MIITNDLDGILVQSIRKWQISLLYGCNAQIPDAIWFQFVPGHIEERDDTDMMIGRTISETEL